MLKNYSLSFFQLFIIRQIAVKCFSAAGKHYLKLIIPTLFIFYTKKVCNNICPINVGEYSSKILLHLDMFFTGFT